MENKKLISTYEFTLCNLILTISLELVYLYIVYFVYKKSQVLIGFYFTLGRKLIRTNSFIQNHMIKFFLTQLVFVIGMFAYFVILIHFFNLSSFYNLQSSLFVYWKNLFRSDSNLTDLNSFQEFYCEINEETYISTQDNKFLKNNNFYLCGWAGMNTVNIWNHILTIVFLINITRILGGNTDRIENDQAESRTNFLFHKYIDILGFIIDQIIKVYFYFLCIYYILGLWAMICAYNNTNNFNLNHTSEYTEIKSNDPKPEMSNNYEYESISDNTSSNTIWKTIFNIIIEIIEEILSP